MNRNVESHFAYNADIEINRSTFDRSQNVKLSGNVGKLIPFFIDEVLPGDTFKVSTSKVIRLQTLLTPVYDNLYADFYYFMIPNRLVWSHWKNFMGENSDSAWLPSVTYQVPQTRMYYLKEQEGVDTDYRVKPGDFLDYLGVPVNVPTNRSTKTTLEDAKQNGDFLEVSSLPYRAYQLVWNEWFRDENLQDPANINTGDSDGRWMNETERLTMTTLFNVCKYHDYFTSCLPAPLKGEPVLAPIQVPDYLSSNGIPVHGMAGMHQGESIRLGYSTTDPSTNNIVRYAQADSTGGFVAGTVNLDQTYGAGGRNIRATNLYADLQGVGINIMSLRNAFQVQKLLEADARSGTRYTEIIKGHFGVNSPDSRLQRPEYLGGNRVPVSIHQITNQSQGEADFLGDVGAMSLTTDVHDDFVYSSTEHGLILGVMCLRYDHTYSQGLERFWSRKTRFDYYWPEFAHLSEMAVLNKEIYAVGSPVDNQVFGYQECYADYRYKPNRVCGEMRPGIDNSLASWHFADYYTSRPYLSDAWLRENRSNVDRTLAVTSAVANQFFADIYIQNYTTRPMPVRSIPGLADHF